MEDVKTWRSSEAAEFFDTGTENLFPDMTNASIPAVARLNSSLCMYVLFGYNNFFFSLLVLLTAKWRLLSE
jgi:hypothetical protein